MFNHVEQEWLRNILLGDVSEDAICKALTYTRQCLEEDSGDEEVSLAALDYRLTWLEDAEYAWNDEGNTMWALESLQNVWR
jgi:hypothetical protein